MSAVDRLRSSQNEFIRNRTTPDFHIELLRLRQNWRLKKVSTAIIGDLSYKTGNLIESKYVLLIIAIAYFPLKLYHLNTFTVPLFCISFVIVIF